MLGLFCLALSEICIHVTCWLFQVIQTLGTEKARPAIAPQVKIRWLPSETIRKQPFVQFCLWRVTCLHMIFCIEVFIMTLTVWKAMPFSIWTDKSWVIMAAGKYHRLKCYWLNEVTLILNFLCEQMSLAVSTKVTGCKPSCKVGKTKHSTTNESMIEIPGKFFNNTN